MTIHRLTRRTVLKGAAALGAIGSLPTPLAAQSGRAASLPGRGDIVIRGAHVLTMDERLGDFASGHVHIRNGAIVAVGADVDVPGAEVIDGRGLICMPGFVDTHWHLWISMLRPYVRSDVGELSVFPVSTRLGQHMTPQDAYVSVRLGIAEALSAGVTTVHNWAHNTRSPEHADAELSAMRDAGIRGRFAYGPAQGMPDDQPMDLDGLARIKRTWMPGDGMLTLGICSRNVGAGSIGGGARGVPLDRHGEEGLGRRPRARPADHLAHVRPEPDQGARGRRPARPGRAARAPAADHAGGARDPQDAAGSATRSRRCRSRAARSNLGVVQLGELLEAGVKVSLSTDHTSNYKCDPFGAMRVLFALHQHRLHNKPPVSLKRLVQLATLDGAVDLGLADQTGSLTPGKRADVILVRTTDANMTLAGDPYETLVSLAEPSNVDTVIVDGRILRRQGKFTALDHGKAVREAREAAAAVRGRAKWPPA